jgi:hypothetical protein
VTGTPFGSAVVPTTRTARTRHFTFAAIPSWNVHHSRSSATFVIVEK